MIPEPNQRIEKYRKRHPTLGSGTVGKNYGYFEIPVCNGTLRAISSGIGDEWEHVSVSLPNRCPTWDEMCVVKDLFWGSDETVIQFHPKRSSYVNAHQHCLHLWKLSGHDCKLPPTELLE